MAQRIIIPRMGQTMTEGVVAKWYKKDGDAVSAGDDIYELEYDKATATVQAKKPGIIRLLCEEGSAASLGETVAVILEDGETLESVNVRSEHAVANSAKAGSQIMAEQQIKTKKENNGTFVLATPMARHMAKQLGIKLSSVVASGADGIVRKSDIKPQGVAHDCVECSKCAPDIKATPMARKLAGENGIDIADIAPADGKRIFKNDVLSYTNKTSKPKRQEKRIPLNGMRKIIAQRMSQSYFSYPTVTLTTDADMSLFMKLREQLNEELAPAGVKVSVTDLLVKAVAKAICEHEIINTSLVDDEIIFHGEINIGIAVALETGLVVPVIKNVEELKIDQIAMETKRLIGLAKSGQIGGDDMAGGTFTITNLGTAGIDAFNPIINYPQSAILGVGRTVEKVVAVNGEIVIQPRAVFSLTHDHRVIDGVPAADFLHSVVKYIEKPFLLLMD